MAGKKGMHQKPEKKKLPLDEDVMIAVARRHGGRKFHMAKELGISSKMMEKYYRHYPRLRRAMDDELGNVLDDVEEKMIEMALQGDFRACRFILVSRGGDRGWNVHHKTENTITIEHKNSEVPLLSRDITDQILTRVKQSYGVDQTHPNHSNGENRETVPQIGLKELPPEGREKIPTGRIVIENGEIGNGEIESEEKGVEEKER